MWTRRTYSLLLILADCLIQLKSAIPGTIKIIHQHAEETPPGGAKSIVESGLLDDLDVVFGTHLFPKILQEQSVFEADMRWLEELISS